MATQSLLTHPKRNYLPNHALMSELPFVSSSEALSDNRAVNYWSAPAIDDYAEACMIGKEFAAHFVQYLKDNPAVVASNQLGLIVNDMDFDDTSAAKGYWVGFFSYLERLLYAQAKRMDVFADLEQLKAQHEVFMDKYLRQQDDDH